jgi:hypothetical protein
MSAGEIAATLKADFTGSPDATEIHSPFLAKLTRRQRRAQEQIFEVFLEAGD